MPWPDLRLSLFKTLSGAVPRAHSTSDSGMFSPQSLTGDGTIGESDMLDVPWLQRDMSSLFQVVRDGLGVGKPLMGTIHALCRSSRSCLCCCRSLSAALLPFLLLSFCISTCTSVDLDTVRLCSRAENPCLVRARLAALRSLSSEVTTTWKHNDNCPVLLPLHPFRCLDKAV